MATAAGPSARSKARAATTAAARPTPGAAAKAAKPRAPRSYINEQQFGNLAPLYKNLTQAGFTAHSNQVLKSTGMEAYRNNLRQATLGSATSNTHSLGTALSENPTMTAGPASKAREGFKFPSLGKLNPAQWGKSASGKGKTRKIGFGPSKHAGSNAENLKRMTGSA